MKIVDCYLRALQKAEENATNGGIKLDKARFVQLFNDEQNRLVRYLLEKKNEDNIRYIQRLVVNKYPISSPNCDYEYGCTFRLPDDFFDFIDVKGVFKSGSCTATDFHLWEAKNENVSELLADEFNKPSFEYREAFYTIGEDGIKIYTLDEFNTTQIYLSYYRYPKAVDIAGYVKSDNSSSRDIDPELDDKLVNIILNMVEKQFALNESEYNRYQVDYHNVQSLL